MKKQSKKTEKKILIVKMRVISLGILMIMFGQVLLATDDCFCCRFSGYDSFCPSWCLFNTKYQDNEIISCTRIMIQKASFAQVNSYLENKSAVYSITIKNKFYDNIPSGVFSGLRIKYLDLSNNRIVSINKTALSNVSGLKELWLIDNQIETIDIGDWSIELEILHIERNQLKYIADEMFSQCFRLKELRMGYNNVTRIEPRALVQLSTLEIIDIRFTSIENVFIYNLSKLTKAYLETNLIKIIWSGMFAGLTQLQRLKLKNNQISRIEPGAFDNLVNLNHLTLEDNVIEVLESNMFKDLTKLTELYISRNNLKSIEAELLTGLTSLTYLYVNSNKIDKIATNSFRLLQSLVYLDMSNEYLDDINSDDLKGLTSVEELRLFNNGLLVVKNMTFSNMTRLRRLNLEVNCIEQIEELAFAGLASLETLNMTKNNISNLKSNRFSHLTNLSHLDLSRNQMKTLERGAFNGLDRRLSFLNMSFNNLEFIQVSHFENLAALEILDLSRNKISSIEPGSFNATLSLLHLSLENNCLFYINPIIFARLGRLEILNLGYNVITGIKDSTFQHVQNSLKSLFLNNNYLTSLRDRKQPLFSKLQRLDLSSNQIYEIDFEFFRGMNSLEHLDLSRVNRSVRVYNSNESILSNLTTLKLAYCSGEFILNFNLSSLKYLDLSHSFDLDGRIFVKIPFDTINGVYLNNVTSSESQVYKLLQQQYQKTNSNVLTHLDISYNDPAISLQLVSLMKNLQVLRAARLNIYELDSNYVSNGSSRNLNLGNMSRLALIDLSKNSLKRVRVSYFLENTQLKYLYLSDNQIELVEEYALSTQSSLTVIDLSYNKLSFFNRSIFGQNYLFELQELMLDHNNLLRLEVYMNRDMYGGIYLSSNRFPIVPMSISIQSSAITNLELSNNSITYLTQINFHVCNQLKYVNLSSNNIISIQDKSFFNLVILIKLDLSSNSLTHLTNLTFAGLINIEYMNLSNNRIEQLPYDVFYELKYLSTLDLSSNRIKILADLTFDLSWLLKFLYFKETPLLNLFTSNTTQGLFQLKYLVVPSYIPMNFSLVVKLKNDTIVRHVKDVLETRYFDPVNIIFWPNVNQTYTDGQCDSIIYLVRFEIQFNLNDDVNMAKVLSDCQLMINKLARLKFDHDHT